MPLKKNVGPRRTEPIRCSPSPSADATSGLLQGARSSTPEPGRRSSRRERLGSSARRPCSAAAARRCVRADSPTRRIPPRRAATKTRLFFLFKPRRSRPDLALPPPRLPLDSSRLFPTFIAHAAIRRRGVRPRVRRGVRPRVRRGTRRGRGIGACQVFFFGVRRFRSGADTSRSALDIL